MKRFVTFLRLFSLATLLVLASCGSDKMQGASTGSNSLTGGECSCNTSGLPVCGINKYGNSVDYINECSAKCYKATNIVQGHCSCSSSGPVCGDYIHTIESECEAQSEIRRGNIQKITKYADCNASGY